MTYNYKFKKIVAVISDDLEPWQAMNVLGHLSIALGANKDDNLMGRDVLTDQEGGAHIGIPRFGFVVKKGKLDDICTVVKEARKQHEVIAIDFPREMLDTRHDDELAESMRVKSEFEYLGILVYGPTKLLNDMTKEFELW